MKIGIMNYLALCLTLSSSLLPTSLLVVGKCIPSVSILKDFQRSTSSPFGVLESSYSGSGRFRKDADPANLTLLQPDKTLVSFTSTAKMYMTLLAKQKVQELAQKIAKVWRGEYFLVVIHSFIPRNGQQTSGIFHTISLHHEGRALDLTLGRKNEDGEIVTIYRDPDMKTKLKELATLARSGELKFNYVKLTGHHIHVSTKRHRLMTN